MGACCLVFRSRSLSWEHRLFERKCRGKSIGPSLGRGKREEGRGKSIGSSLSQCMRCVRSIQRCRFRAAPRFQRTATLRCRATKLFGHRSCSMWRRCAGRYTNSNITGLTHIDFIALPPKARISITYQVPAAARARLHLGGRVCARTRARARGFRRHWLGLACALGCSVGPSDKLERRSDSEGGGNGAGGWVGDNPYLHHVLLLQRCPLKSNHVEIITRIRRNYHENSSKLSREFVEMIARIRRNDRENS